MNVWIFKIDGQTKSFLWCDINKNVNPGWYKLQSFKKFKKNFEKCINKFAIQPSLNQLLMGSSGFAPHYYIIFFEPNISAHTKGRCLNIDWKFPQKLS